MIIYDADDPLVVNGTYDREGYKPGERRRITRARARRQEDETMAKKKKGTKKKGGKPRYRAAAPARRPRQIPRTQTRRSPRSQVLPGMEQARSRKLDNLCEGIGDTREQKNAAVKEETSLVSSALQVMVREAITVYRHGGIELARIPGAEKLRVRVTKETGDAGEDDLEPVPAASSGVVDGGEGGFSEEAVGAVGQG